MAVVSSGVGCLLVGLFKWRSRRRALSPIIKKLSLHRARQRYLLRTTDYLGAVGTDEQRQWMAVGYPPNATMICTQINERQNARRGCYLDTALTQPLRFEIGAIASTRSMNSHKW